MDTSRRARPRYAVTEAHPLGEVKVVMSDGLWTHGEPGIYRAAFDRATVETIKSRTTGNQYQRLSVRFRLVDGPWIKGDGTPKCAGASVAGRVVALWHELDIGPDATLQISPNAWFWPGVARHLDGRRSLANAVEAWAGSVRWVLVSRSQVGSRLGPAKVTGVGYREAPPMEWFK